MAASGEGRKGLATSICYVTLGVSAFVLFLFSLISFSSFAYLQTKISRQTVYGNETYGHCILYADFNESTTGSYPLIELGRSNACGFAIYGEIVLAVYALIFVFLPCIKAIFKRDARSCDLIVELVLHVVAAVFAFLIGVVLSSGLNDTCDAVSQTQNGTCGELVIPEPGGEDNSTSVAFFRNVKVSEVTAWFSWVTLMIIIAFYLMWICMVCLQLKKAKETREMLGEERGEHSHDPEDGDKHGKVV